MRYISKEPGFNLFHLRNLGILFLQLYRSVAFDLDPDQNVGCALIALGGYGRAEMNPRSDIDLMFYYQDQGQKVAKTIVID